MENKSEATAWEGKAMPVASQCELGKKAHELLTEDLSPRHYVELLADKKLFPDAVAFMASVLSKREAVWWACCCARAAAGADFSTLETSALQAAEEWVADPAEPNRRATKPAAQAAKLATPAGCSAMAAFLSGGSLAPPDVKAVPPAADLTPKMVAGAVTLAAVSKEPAKAPEKFREFLGMGMEIAEGRNLWTSPS